MPIISSCSVGAADVIRFEINSVDPLTGTVVATVTAVPTGLTVDDLPDVDAYGTVQVCDPLGCYFNEPADQLVGRQGWARYMQSLVMVECQPDAYSVDDLVPQWEVFSLCCGFEEC